VASPSSWADELAYTLGKALEKEGYFAQLPELLLHGYSPDSPWEATVDWKIEGDNEDPKHLANQLFQKARGPWYIRITTDGGHKLLSETMLPEIPESAWDARAWSRFGLGLTFGVLTVLGGQWVYRKVRP